MTAIHSTTMPVQNYDELAALMARQLTLSSAPKPAPPAMEQLPSQPKITYSASQHYYPSSPSVHLMHTSTSEQQQQQQAELAQRELLAVRDYLKLHGVDPSSLTLDQLTLFRKSTPDRRDYLIQLWRIYPQTGRDVGNEAMSLDGTAVSVSVAPRQAANGCWEQPIQQSYMEPYMQSGYEELSRREYLASGSGSGSALASDVSAIPRSSGVTLRTEATDPVYNNRLDTSGRASWPPLHMSASTDIADQYGTLMALRESGAMEL